MIILKKGHSKHSQKLVALLKTQYIIIILSIISIECQCTRNDTKIQTNFYKAQPKIIYKLEKNEDFKIPVSTLRNVGYFKSVFEN